jgi:hypothetical protein
MSSTPISARLGLFKVLGASTAEGYNGPFAGHGTIGFFDLPAISFFPLQAAPATHAPPNRPHAFVDSGNYGTLDA